MLLLSIAAIIICLLLSIIAYQLKELVRSNWKERAMPLLVFEGIKTTPRQKEITYPKDYYLHGIRDYLHKVCKEYDNNELRQTHIDRANALPEVSQLGMFYIGPIVPEIGTLISFKRF